MSPMKIKVISPDGIKFQGECSSIMFPVFDGYFGIQPGYENSVFKLTKGEITIKGIIDSSEETKKIPVSSGTLMCENGEITIVL